MIKVIPDIAAQPALSFDVALLIPSTIIFIPKNIKIMLLMTIPGVIYFKIFCIVNAVFIYSTPSILIIFCNTL